MELRFALIRSMMLSGVVLGMAVEEDLEVAVSAKRGFPRCFVHSSKVAIFLQEAKSLLSADC